MTVKMTPETYSGVAELAIEKVESDRSSFDPSRIPASTPMRRAVGTISTITQNIRMPVRVSRVEMMEPTLSLKTEEKPQLPCRMPQKRGAAAGSAPRGKQRPMLTP